MRIVQCLFIIIITLSAPAAAGQQVYVCPMHAHIEGEKGDSCPVCGMDLVPKSGTAQGSDNKQAHKGHGNEGHDNVMQIDPDYVQALGVKTATVKHREFGRNIRAFAQVVPSTRREVTLDMRSPGWIVDLEADAVGESVEKGDLLFTYQSAELMSAQSDYLLQEGGKFSGIDPGLRLRLYGMEKKAIERLDAQGGMLAETPFHAPASSTLQSLNVREGAYVKKGATVLTLQDYSRVWIEADVPVRDLQFLTEGQKATVIVPQTGKRYITRIDLIRDTVDPTTRTGRVRLVVEQDKHRLRPGTYVDVEFSAYVEKRLAVPMEAVLYGGDGAIVIESLGEGRFRPVEVETGITARGYTEITDGLKAGRDIVKTGQFMIDAESNLRGGMAEMDGHSEQNDTMKKQGENGHDH